MHFPHAIPMSFIRSCSFFPGRISRQSFLKCMPFISPYLCVLLTLLRSFLCDKFSVVQWGHFTACQLHLHHHPRSRIFFFMEAKRWRPISHFYRKFLPIVWRRLLGFFLLFSSLRVSPLVAEVCAISKAEMQFLVQLHLSRTATPPARGPPPTWAACQHIVYQMQSWQPLTMTCSEQTFSQPFQTQTQKGRQLFGDSRASAGGGGSVGGHPIGGTFEGRQKKIRRKMGKLLKIPEIGRCCSVCHAFCGQNGEYISHAFCSFCAKALCAESTFIYLHINYSIVRWLIFLVGWLRSRPVTPNLPPPTPAGSLSKNAFAIAFAIDF